jgi:glycosyltransferase involved in cell wall biosynthesis
MTGSRPAAPLSGNVDGVTRDGFVSGWAWDPARPRHRVRLEILIDGAPVGSTTAATWRADLQQAGIGDGAHGFAYVLPYNLLASDAVLRVAVRERGRCRALGEPTLLRLPARPHAELAQPCTRGDQGPVGRALVVDDRIPRPDHDAGSVIALAYMTLLRDLGWEVWCAAAHGAADGTDRLRLEQAGILPILPPDGPTSVLERHGARLDLVLLVRHANAAAFGPRVRRLAPRAQLVFAPGDLHFLRLQREAALTGGRITPAWRAARSQELACVAAADATLVMSDTEQAMLASELPQARLHLLRWVAEPAAQVPPFSLRRDMLFVGNFEHRPNLDAVLWYAEAVLPALRAARPGLTLHVAGPGAPPCIAALAGPDIAVHGHVAHLDGLLDRVRLSVAPLRYGAGFKGKVATSLARGVPVVGTAMALEGTGLMDGDGVVLADAPAAIARAIAALHDCAASWGRLSARALAVSSTLYGRAGGTAAMLRLLASLGLPYRLQRAAADDHVVDP